MVRVGDLGRRLYADLVRGRTTVRVVSPEADVNGLPPVFLIGAYRSGTTLLRLMLDSHSQIACPPETMHLALLRDLLDNDASRDGFLAMGYDSDYVLTSLRDSFDHFHRAYATSLGKSIWADKSPEYVWHIDWIASLFPRARFVFLTRKALDQVESHILSSHDLDSRLHRWLEPAVGNYQYEIAATYYWKDAVAEQLTFLDANPSRAMHVRYEDLCENPAAEVDRILRFLGLEFEEGCVRYWHSRHDFGREDNRARAANRVSRRTSTWAERWPLGLIQECDDIASAMMRRLGW